MIGKATPEKPNGQISIMFRRNNEGKTYMARQFFQIPLQILRPHYYDVDGTAVVYSMNPAGGVLQHDRLLTEIESEAGTDAIFTTPGNTKFYKMDDDCAKVWNRAYVHSGGVLEYLPEHNVPFAKARVYQENDFYVEKDAVLFAADMVTAGRVASGEVFQYDLYHSRTRLFVDGKLKLYDNCNLMPVKNGISGTGLLDGYLSNGSMYVYACNMDPKLSVKVSALSSKEIKLAAGNITPDIMVVRFLGDSIIDMTEMMQNVWDVCRKSILGKPALHLRKEFSGMGRSRT